MTVIAEILPRGQVQALRAVGQKRTDEIQEMQELVRKNGGDIATADLVRDLRGYPGNAPIPPPIIDRT